jgi:hypothetical protein
MQKITLFTLYIPLFQFNRAKRCFDLQKFLADAT